MALDSAGRGPLLLGYPERLWPHQVEPLGPIYPSAAMEWARTHRPQSPPPEALGTVQWKRREPSRQRSTARGALEREAVQLPWQPPAYPRKEQKPDDVIVSTKAGALLPRQPFRHWSSQDQSDDVMITAETRPRTSSLVRYAYDGKNNPLTSWQRFVYENRNNPVDVTMTSASATVAGSQSPWQLSAMQQVKDQASADDIMTSYRERSQSMGSWRSFGASRGPHGGSTVSWNGTEDFQPTSAADQKSETLSETTYRALVNLWASSRANQRNWDLDRTHNQAEVPRSPLVEEARRRFSEASQRQYLRVRLQQARQRYDDLPIDMTCRKRKTKTMSPAGPAEHATPASLNSDMSTISSEINTRSNDSSTLSSELSSASSIPRTLLPETSHRLSPQNPSVDHRSDPEEPCDQTSILRSMLTERGRSYSMSVLELRRRRLEADRLAPSAPDANGSGGQERTRLATISTTTSSGPFNASEKQLVTLAKKNLLPVTARITDLLGRIADFARSLPEFLRLSPTDRESVLMSACLRLLVLYMAETNLQFATTVVSPAERTGEGLLPATRADLRPRQPTVQFVGSLQNFVRKCQALNVTGEEYFQMKLITLFHSGVGSVDCVRSSARINSVARQDLQESVHRSHPNERLRYSTLLLSLHTLFGIHCDMLRSLFCQHLNKTGGIQAVIAEALAAELGDENEVK